MASSSSPPPSDRLASRATKQPNSLPACDECRNRKIKCNRQLPVCSNCRKAKMDCEFPTRDKKGSQVKQIASDMATVNERLSMIEGNLTQRIEMLSDMVSQSISSNNARPQISSRQSSEDVDESYTDSEDEVDQMTDSAKAQGGNKISKPGVLINDGSAERFYGETSTYSHFTHARQLVKDIIDRRQTQDSNSSVNQEKSFGRVPQQHLLVGYDQPSLDEAQQQYDSYVMPSFYQENLAADEKQALELPPRELLEASVDFYLKSPSLEPPLFQRETLATAIQQQYQVDCSQVDEAWVLCFNSIILRSMGWVSKIVRNDYPLINSIDDQLRFSLLTNINRALANTEQFSTLRIVNVQALFLLALVARDYINFNIFERTFDKACHVAKQMGLHQRGIVGNSPSTQNTERQNLLWILYLVDKQRIFIRGSLCRIYIFECNMELPTAGSDGTGKKSVVAHLKLACLLEEVYMQLYTPKACRLKVTVIQDRIRHIDQQLQSWSVEFRSESEVDDGASLEKALPLQLQYAFHITRLLVNSRITDENNACLRLEMARAALGVIQTLCNGSYIFHGGLLVLERIFCDYSVVAFYEVFVHVLGHPQAISATDLDLLATTTSALGLLSHPSRPDSYCNRLHKNFTWCMSIATIFSNTNEPRRKATPVPLLPQCSGAGWSSPRKVRAKRGSPPLYHPSLYHRNNSSRDWNSDVNLTVEENASSSHNRSNLESPTLNLNMDQSDSHDPFSNEFSTNMVGLDDYDFGGDALIDQCFTTLDFTSGGLTFGQPRVPNLFDTAVSTNADHEQIMKERGQQNHPFGQQLPFQLR